MSEHPQQTDRTLRDTRILTLRIWGVVGCIVIAAVIFNLMGILAPVIEFLAVGSIIAFVMSPITNWLEHHGVNRGIGSLIALIVVVAVLVGVVCILSPILLGQIMEVLSRLPEQLRVAGGDLNEMISHAKTLNNTPLKEYLDDNLSSLVTVASKYVSQIAAELGRGVFPLITNTASQLFVIFLAWYLLIGWPATIPVCTTRSAPSSDRKRRPRTALWWPSFRARSVATCAAWSSRRSAVASSLLSALRSLVIPTRHSWPYLRALCTWFRLSAPG